MEPSCTVFDIDDTLYLEHDYVMSGLQAVDRLVRARCLKEGFFALARADFLAGSRGDLFDRALGSLGVVASRDLIAELVDCYRRHRPAIVLLPDAREALLAAALAGQVAIITDGPVLSQQAKVAALSLTTWADPVVLTGQQFPDRPKPDPAAFLHVQRLLGVQGQRCTYVADNPLKDFSGPTSLGWRTVRVRRAGGLHALLDSGADVDLEVETLRELAVVL